MRARIAQAGSMVAFFPPSLTSKGRKIILEATEIYVSAASIWEIAIKRRLGKIDGDPRELAAAIEASGFHSLPITPRHAALVETLPRHHRDPFDRLLIAQALAEPLRLLTVDKALQDYSRLPAGSAHPSSLA